MVLRCGAERRADSLVVLICAGLGGGMNSEFRVLGFGEGSEGDDRGHARTLYRVLP